MPGPTPTPSVHVVHLYIYIYNVITFSIIEFDTSTVHDSARTYPQSPFVSTTVRVRGLRVRSITERRTYYVPRLYTVCLEKFPNLISVVNINSVIANTTNASYSVKSNEYVYKISTRLVISVSSCIRLCTRCVHGTSNELTTRNKEVQ